MAINYKGRLLRKKDGDPHLYPWTEALSKRDDVYECDAEGKALNPDEGATVPVVATGLTIPPPAPTAPPLSVVVPPTPGQETTLGSADAQAQADAEAAQKKVADEAAAKEKADAEAKARAAEQAQPPPATDIDKLEDQPVAGARRSGRRH